MKKTIGFYNRDGRWYADLPDYIESGGAEEECEMVAGADEWLEYLSNGKDRITLKISSLNEYSNNIRKYHEDEFGATYIAHEYNENPINMQLWLCPVTLFVFGEYPPVISYRVS